MMEVEAFRYALSEASFGEVLKFLTKIRPGNKAIVGFLPDYVRNYVVYMNGMPDFITESFKLGELFFAAARLWTENDISDEQLIKFYGKKVSDFVFDYGELLSIPYVVVKSGAFDRESKRAYIELFKYRLMEAMYVYNYGNFNLLYHACQPTDTQSAFLQLAWHAINFFKARTECAIIDNRDMYLADVMVLPETEEVAGMKELVGIIDSMEKTRTRVIAPNVREALGTVNSFKIK